MYTDEYRWVPLVDALAERLEFLVDGVEAESTIEVPDRDSRDEELQGLGYVRGYTPFRSGGARMTVNSKGVRYFTELAQYNARKARYEQERREEIEAMESRGKRHDWGVAVVNGAWAVIGGAVALLVERLLGG